MTADEKFRQGIVVYQIEDDYILEMWGASTRHPDSIFHFSDFEKCEYFGDREQVFQWLLECASKLTFPQHARKLVDYAIENWYFFKKYLTNNRKSAIL